MDAEGMSGMKTDKQTSKQAAQSFFSCALLTSTNRNCKDANSWHRIVDDIYTDDGTGCGRLAKRLGFLLPATQPSQSHLTSKLELGLKYTLSKTSVRVRHHEQ
jgi:hypothetical protein